MSTQTAPARTSAGRRNKRGRQPEVRNKVLLTLRGTDGKPRSELGISPSYAEVLISQGYIKKADAVVHTGRRGRPQHTYRLDKRGRDHARRLALKIERGDQIPLAS